MKNLAVVLTVFLLCLVMSSDGQSTSELDSADKSSNGGEIDDAIGQWSIPIIQLSNTDTFDPFQPFEREQNTDNAKLNVVTVPLVDLQSAATEYDKHKGHKEGHHSHKGHKGKKGFHADEGHKKKHYEDHGKHHKRGHHDKGGKHYKGHDHHKKHYGDWHKGKKGKKGHHHHIKGHHNKGHKDKGFKNIYHKEEYGHNKKFYDDYDFKKHHKKYDDSDLHYKGHKGDNHKSGQYKGDKHHDKFSKKGEFHKDSKHNDDHGHKKKYGHKKHYHEDSKHSHKKGGDKKYGHKHGHKHGHHDHYGHHSEQHPFYQNLDFPNQPITYEGNDKNHGSHNMEELEGQYSSNYPHDDHDHYQNNEENEHHLLEPNNNSIGLSESQPSETYSVPRSPGEPQHINDGDSDYDDEPTGELASSEQQLTKIQDSSDVPNNEYEPDYIAIDEQETDYYLTTSYPEGISSDPNAELKTKSNPIRNVEEFGKQFIKAFELMPPPSEPSFQQPIKDQRKPFPSRTSFLRHPRQRFSSLRAPIYRPQRLEAMNRHRFETPHRDVYWKYQIKEYPKYDKQLP